MTKKVSKRGWSFEKFAASVKAEAKRLNVKLNATKLRKAYEDGLTVRYAVASLSK
ncbi:MAG: hypothetical protein IT536_08295 [Hyphomicrobiales bacterium]|nr:hypothetical protein [Hyphomicrobiales bacterium]